MAAPLRKEGQKFQEDVIKINFMKSKIVLSLFFVGFFFRINAQVFLINLNDSAFIFNENTLKANEKTCLVFNCLSKSQTRQGNNSLRPLLLFKVFDYKCRKKIVSKPGKSISISDYLTNSVVPKLNLDMQLKANDFEVSNSDPNYHLIDSLIVNDGTSYNLIQGGVLILEFFNVFPFKQTNPLQTNQSAFNINANVIEVGSWVLDSLPIPNVEAMIDGRIFLLKKEINDYTFFRHAFDCSDCPLTFYNEYVYRKDYGIIAFKSKYLQFYKGDISLRDPYAGRILESDKYYYFK